MRITDSEKKEFVLYCFGFGWNSIMVLVWIALVSCVLGQPVLHQPVDYVNPLIGTAPPEDKEYLGNNPPEGEELYCGVVVPGMLRPTEEELSLGYPWWKRIGFWFTLVVLCFMVIYTVFW
jgi:hypothetical protein